MHDEIVDAAVTLLDETGDPSSLTLRGVARATGVKAPSIYPHFDGIDEIVTALIEHSFSQLESDVSDALAAAPSLGDGLHAAAHAYVRFGWEHPARYRLMFAASGYAEHAVNAYTLVEQTLTHCVADGTSTSTDPHRDTFLLWVALHGIATLEKPGRAELLRLGPIDRDAAIDDLVERLAKITHRP